HAQPPSCAARDVTTTVRQHPGESLLRFATLVVAVFAVGLSPAAFAVYRAAAALNGLLEHANLSAPRWLDGGLALVTTWPHMHKIHPSRVSTQTDTNYGNLFSVWDRVFGTFTPSDEGRRVAFGLEGYDEPAIQTTRGLLAVPFREQPSVAPMPAGHAPARA